MKRVQRGFTLIELVMVIVILGVLAAVAMPKFVDLKGDAQQAAMQATAGSAASASAINYGGCSLVNNVATVGTPVKCRTVNSCDSIKLALNGGDWPAGYSSTTTAIVANGLTSTCTLTLTGFTPSPAITFDVISAGI